MSHDARFRAAGARRTALYRKHQSFLNWLKELKKARVLTSREFQLAKVRADAAYTVWKADFLKTKPRSDRPRGRPKTPLLDRSDYTHCKRPHCSNPVASNQAYCSRICAPYGYLGFQKESE